MFLFATVHEKEIYSSNFRLIDPIHSIMHGATSLIDRRHSLGVSSAALGIF